MLKWLKNAGPGALVAAAFIGPGTVTVCSIAGIRFGYTLLWAMVLSTVATIILQEMAARLGIISQKGLAEIIRAELGNPLIRYGVLTLILLAIVFGNAIYEAGNISGSVLGLNTLINIDPQSFNPLIAVVGVIAFTLLYIGNYRIIEKALVGLVILMSIAFLLTAIITRPNFIEILSGMMIPKIDASNLLTVVGLIGTTVVPYNLFLHASLVKEKWNAPEDLSHARKDTFVSVALGGVVSMAIIISAARVTSTEVMNAVDLAKGLEPLFGSFAKYFLSIGMFSAGITSAITAPLAAAYVTSGCLGWDSNLKNNKFRATWMSVLLLGVFFSSLGINPIEIIQFAQIANGIALPIIVAIIIWIMNKHTVLGKYINSKVQNVLGIIILSISVILGVKSIIQVLGL